jgi:chromosome segregation ATPase
MNRNRALQRAGLLINHGVIKNPNKENETNALQEENKSLREELLSLKVELATRAKNQDRLQTMVEEMESTLLHYTSENAKYKKLYDEREEELEHLKKHITRPFYEESPDDTNFNKNQFPSSPTAEQSVTLHQQNEQIQTLTKENKDMQTKISNIISEQEQLTLQLKIQQEEAVTARQELEREHQQILSTYETQINSLLGDQTQSKDQICKLLSANNELSKTLNEQRQEAEQIQTEQIHKFEVLLCEKNRIESLISENIRTMTQLEERTAGIEIAQSFYTRLQNAISLKQVSKQNWKDTIESCNDLIQRVIIDLERLFGTMFPAEQNQLSSREVVVKFVLQLLIDHGKLHLTVNDLSDEVVRLVEQKNALFMESLNRPTPKVVKRRR